MTYCTLLIVCFYFIFLREYQASDSPGEPGETATLSSQDLTPAQQHQQYLGESKPELVPFNDIDWQGAPLPGQIPDVV